MKALIASLIRWAQGIDPDDRFWVERTAPRGWQAGDFAECRIAQGSGWGPRGAGIFGPAAGEVRQVLEVIDAPQIDSATGAIGDVRESLRFARWPHSYSSAWFRRVTPRHDALRPCTADFEILAEVIADRQAMGGGPQGEL